MLEHSCLDHRFLSEKDDSQLYNKVDINILL